MPDSTERKAALDAMLKADLREEVDRLDALLASSATLDDEPPVHVLAVHVAGAAHRGTHVLLERCGTAGDDAKLWHVRAGDKVVLCTGQAISGRPWHAIKPVLQRQAAMHYADALRLARKVR